MDRDLLKILVPAAADPADHPKADPVAHYTQILVDTERPTQILSALKGLDILLFPHTPAGTLVCERTSEALDVRIVLQVVRDISMNLGGKSAVLGIAAEDDGPGFWCGLFYDGILRFQHNRLTGPRDFAEHPASPAEVATLCIGWCAGGNEERVYEALTDPRFTKAADRHAALAQALELPVWSPGIGYFEAAEGRVPPEAGVPQKPPRSLQEIRPAAGGSAGIDASDSLTWFHKTCDEEFGFLTDFGFHKAPSRNATNVYPQIINRLWIMGSGSDRPGYKNAYMASYRSRHLTVVIEGLSFGGRTRLCLIDPAGRHLDLTGLVEARDPEMLDLCQLADGQSEQIPIFAEALRKHASDVLAGDLSAISREELGMDFSFSAFSSPADADYVLALHGPRWMPRTAMAQIRRAVHLGRVRAQIWKASRLRK